MLFEPSVFQTYQSIPVIGGCWGNVVAVEWGGSVGRRRQRRRMAGRAGAEGGGFAARRAAIRAAEAVALPAGSGAVAGRSVAGSVARASLPSAKIYLSKDIQGLTKPYIFGYYILASTPNLLKSSGLARSFSA